MRRTLVVGLLVAFTLGAFAAPAAAQRDPFDPLVSEDTGTGVPDGQTDGSTVVEPAPVTPPLPEGLANTGSDIEPFMALAYGLLVAGAAAVVLSRTLRPTPVAPRRRAR